MEAGSEESCSSVVAGSGIAFAVARSRMGGECRTTEEFVDGEEEGIER